MERDELLKDITILDFLAVDLHLYLDTHPMETEAIELYNQVVRDADKLRCKYEKMYGPLCSFRSASRDRWTWIDCPWPWDYSFNFELAGEERF